MKLLIYVIAIFNIILVMWNNKKLYSKKLRTIFAILSILVIIVEFCSSYLLLSDNLKDILSICELIIFLVFLVVTAYVVRVSWKKK